MRAPPSPLKCLRYPVTTSMAVLAVVATLLWWWSGEKEIGYFGNGDFLHEPWRLFTPVFFHGHVIHLLFNLCWFWAFDTMVEEGFGHVAALGIFALLAAGTTAAEFALFRGGIGLSGIVFGLFGLLWVLSRTDLRFEDAIDRGVIELMVGWFMVCIVLTMAQHMWDIANVAHGAGCALGILLGWTITAQTRGQRLRKAIILGATLILFIEGATIARHCVNVPTDAGASNASQGLEALESGNYVLAIALYEQAVGFDPNMYTWWKNLATAYRHVGQLDKAKVAEDKATRLTEFHRPDSK